MPSDHARIARAIQWLVARHPEVPSLEALAGELGLSPFHFQRMFAARVGMSPKRFSQYLFLRDARERLARGERTLRVAVDMGLSGPGRLQDLLVSCEAMTPGEYQAGGAGLVITYGEADSPFGRVCLAATGRGLCHLEFIAAASPTSDAHGGDEFAAEGIRTRFPAAVFRRDEAWAERIAGQVFRHSTSEAPGELLRLHVRGTNFQMQVWQALLQLPEGTAISYGTLAAALGRPGAARAVGQAVGANPVAVLIPCHRVLRESGALGGYRWGLERKRTLLAWESASNDVAA